jgi:hypothetical protein
MIKTLRIVIWVVWAVSIIGLGTSIGVVHGWEHHGWIGATALGFIGFVVGAMLACSPMTVLEFMSAAI